jgi:hypothetical protein
VLDLDEESFHSHTRPQHRIKTTIDVKSFTLTFLRGDWLCCHASKAITIESPLDKGDILMEIHTLPILTAADLHYRPKGFTFLNGYLRRKEIFGYAWR